MSLTSSNANNKRVLPSLVLLFVLNGCGGSGSSTPAQVISDPTTPPAPAPAPTPSGTFVTEVETTLNADGPNIGESAYSLIQTKFAEGSIEAPDFYSSDHNTVPHIIEDQDATVGPHFVFLAHRDADFDRGVASDRQRNEIKTFDRSSLDLQAFKGETFQYSWKFKVSSDQELSSRFTHFFQIKARNYSPEAEDNVNGNDNQPVITITGAEKSSTGNMLQVRYSPGNNIDGTRDSDTQLAEIDWFSITDEWISVFVQITFDEADQGGAFKMTLSRLSDEQAVIDIDRSNIDMWRGQLERDFSRPKWGIYRSVVETSSLRSDEEQVRFADFSIKKGRLTE